MTKSLFISAALLLFVGLSFTSCKKEEQKSFSEQLTATWNSQSVKVDDANVTSVYAFNIALRSDGTFTLKTITTNPLTQQSSTAANTGNWSTDETAQTITLNFDNAPTQTWAITNLSGAGMTATYTDEGSHKYEIVFSKI